MNQPSLFYIDIEPDELHFDSEYVDPYNQRQPDFEDVRQAEIDELDEVIRSIGGLTDGQNL